MQPFRLLEEAEQLGLLGGETRQPTGVPKEDPLAAKARRVGARVLAEVEERLAGVHVVEQHARGRADA